jgi:hypothetical protein
MNAGIAGVCVSVNSFAIQKLCNQQHKRFWA